ncbi:MAG: hypothetical protein KGM49_13555, partial [Sphingomonadales bacterium]|nr:hypothetical protein [Sphingomonadales bacterium]
MNDTPAAPACADTTAAAIAKAIVRLRSAGRVSPSDRDDALALARSGLQAGLAGQAIPLLAALQTHCPADTSVTLLHGVALRQQQRLGEAAAVFAAARSAGCADPLLLQGLAQTRYELGLPAAALFGDALQVLPDDAELARNHATALAAEGEPLKAESLLEAHLVAQPDWLDGHKALATLRWTRGDQSRFAESYAIAVQARPSNSDLWLAWFRALAQTRAWDAARAVLDQAERAIGQSAALMVSRLFVASEAGDLAEAERLLAVTASFEGETVALCRVRHHLRQGRPREAEAEALRYLLTPSATLFWPYLSLAWRLAGDSRHVW